MFFRKSGAIFSDFEANYKYKGFEPERFSKASKTYTLFEGSHISDDGNHVVVRLRDSHLLETKYGYGVIVDAKHVIFIKKWQIWGKHHLYRTYLVSFSREYFKVSEWGDFSDRFDELEDLNESSLSSFENLLALAKEQDAFDKQGRHIDSFREIF